MVELGVATIHLKYPKLDDADLHQLAVSFFDIAEKGVREFIPVDAHVVLEVEQASLKVRSRIFAGAMAVGTLLSQYGNVRQGASYFGNDIYKAGDFIIKEIKHYTGVPSSKVIATRRSATFARRIKRIFDEVERGRINSDEAMRQLVMVLDPDGEGIVSPELIQELKKEIEAAGDGSKKQPTFSRPNEQPPPYVLWEESKSENPRQSLPRAPREKSLRPRRLRITRERGQIKISEVD